MNRRILVTTYTFYIILICFSLTSCSNISQASSLSNSLKYELITSLTNIDYKTADKILNKMEKKYHHLNNSQKCDYHYFNGCYYYSNLMYEKAEKGYNKCLELNEAYIQALYSRAELRSIYLDDFTGAIEDYEKIIMVLNYAEETDFVSENSLITLYTIIIEPIDTNFFGKTSRFNSTTSKSHELKSYCYGRLADICFKNEQYRKTIEYIAQLQKYADPSHSENLQINKKLAECYFKLAEYQNSIKAFTDYSASIPEGYYAFYRIGTCYFFLEDYKNCVDQLNLSHEKMSNINFEEIDNYTELENNEIISDRNSIAKEEYSKILESLLFYRARSLGKLTRYSEAIADLTSILETKPDYLDALYYRGYFFNYSGNQKSALNDFLKVIRLDPDRTSLNYSIALIYDSYGEFDLAAKYYTEFITNTKNKSSGKFLAAEKRLKKLMN